MKKRLKKLVRWFFVLSFHVVNLIFVFYAFGMPGRFRRAGGDSLAFYYCVLKPFLFLISVHVVRFSVMQLVAKIDPLEVDLATIFEKHQLLIDYDPLDGQADDNCDLYELILMEDEEKVAHPHIIARLLFDAKQSCILEMCGMLSIDDRQRLALFKIKRGLRKYYKIGGMDDDPVLHSVFCEYEMLLLIVRLVMSLERPEDEESDREARQYVLSHLYGTIPYTSFARRPRCELAFNQADGQEL